MSKLSRWETVHQFMKRKDLQFKKDQSLISMKDIGRRGKHFFNREAWTFLPQHNLKDKVFIIERLKKVRFDGRLAYRKFWKKDDIEYRLGYFIKGRIRKAKGRWVWGQYCPLIPLPDFNKLIAKAIKEKTILTKL